MALKMFGTGIAKSIPDLTRQVSVQFNNTSIMKGDMVMKKFVCVFCAVLIAICSFLSFSEAALLDRGDGLIYDDDLDITWLQYANYSGQTMSWDEAMLWSADLIYQGYNDWRLPSADMCNGSACTSGEMGHLYVDEGISSDTSGFFLDVRPFMYWSGTEDSADPSKAFRFNFSSGTSGTSAKTYTRYAWAVRDGDSTAPLAPEPVSAALFISGGITMGLRIWQKRTSTG